MRINAVLTDELLKRIDQVAGEQKKSRSLFIREATERYIAEHERLKEEKRRREASARAVAVQDRLRKKAGRWDGTGEIKKWRGKSR